MSIAEQLAQFEEIRSTVARVSAFMFVFLLWCACVWVWWLRLQSRRRRLDERLGIPELHAGPARELRLWNQGEEFTTVVADAPGGVSWRKRFESWRQQAQVDAPPSTIILGTIGFFAIVSLAVFTISGSLLAVAGAIIVSAILLWTYAKQRALRGTVLFETQFVDALDLAARSLRAGHPLTGAFQLAGEEIPAPVGSIFQDVCKQQELGVGLDDALRKSAQANTSPDLKLFATSVIIQLESGGNLAEMMGRLAAVIRERIRLNRHARILMAQTQLSKRILLALPFVLFVVLATSNPAYLVPLYTTPEGRMLVGIGAASLAFGTWVMNRMTMLRY